MRRSAGSSTRPGGWRASARCPRSSATGRAPTRFRRRRRRPPAASPRWSRTSATSAPWAAMRSRSSPSTTRPSPGSWRTSTPRPTTCTSCTTSSPTTTGAVAWSRRCSAPGPAASSVGCSWTPSGRDSSRCPRCSSGFAAAGIPAHEALPAGMFRRNAARFDLRNHRKIGVIDNRVGFTGSQNLVNPGFVKGFPNEELVARVEGPVVLQLQAVFLQDWYFETGELPADPDAFAIPAPRRRDARASAPQRARVRARERPGPPRPPLPPRRAADRHHHAVLRARRTVPPGPAHRRAPWRGGAPRGGQSGGQVGHGAGPAVLLRRAPGRRRANPPLPAALPPRQARDGGRGPGHRRLRQHGHPLLRTERRGGAPGVRPGGRAGHAYRPGEVHRRVHHADQRGVGPASAGGSRSRRTRPASAIRSSDLSSYLSRSIRRPILQPARSP